MGASWVGPALVAATAVTWFVLEVIGLRRRRPDADPADRGSLALLRITTLLAFGAAAAVALLAPAASYGPVLRYVLALVLAWAGIAIRWRSKKALGDLFTYDVRTSDAQPVVTTGPYRWVRHPAYLGMCLALTGFAALLGNWLSLLVFVPVMLVGVVRRIRVEESALLAASGDAYGDYAHGRARLVPHVW